MSEYNKVIQIEPQHDQFDDVRMEYAQMLKQQLAKGNNGLVRTKYITFSIEAKSVREAKPRLERIETDILNNFKVLGVKAYPLNGVERLQIMYETFHQEEQQKFDFSYDRILQSGMTTKDFIAPTSFLFKSGKDFMMGDTYGAASYLNILAPELTDKVLAEFLDMDKNLVVSIHVQSVDQLKAIKLIKGKITDLDRMKIEEQKKAVRSGYDMEIIPSDLATYGGEAKKILDDLQSRNERMFLVTVLFLNEEKLVTYPRTDSQFVTEDMRTTVESLVLALDGTAADVSCVINNSKVTDHHAILPTMQSAKCNKEKLSETKQKILSLIIWKLVQAVQPPFIYEDVLVTVCCQGRNFTAKYKDVLQPGYTAKPVPLVEPEKNKDASLPNDLEQGMVIPVVRAEKKQGFTSPPKVYTEDTLLSAMETAGNKEFEKDTEKKGLGTPATRAAILEKLVSSGYVQRKGKQMIPTEDGVAAIRNIPDYLKSASMTAEWENDLLRMERGEIKPYDFMQGIHGLIDKMLADLRQIPTVAAAPHHNKVSVGNCPVCGNPVHESKLSFCCADRSCKFALWKESRYLSNMRKTLDKKMAVDLLKKGRTHVKDFYSAKKDKTFAADLVMRVEEGRAQYSLEFPKTPMKMKT